jgi:hypothetical protein
MHVTQYSDEGFFMAFHPYTTSNGARVTSNMQCLQRSTCSEFRLLTTTQTCVCQTGYVANLGVCVRTALGSDHTLADGSVRIDVIIDRATAPSGLSCSPGADLCPLAEQFAFDAAAALKVQRNRFLYTNTYTSAGSHPSCGSGNCIQVGVHVCMHVCLPP